MSFTLVSRKYLGHLANWQSAFNAQVLLLTLTFTASTTLAENVSSEISNHIEQTTNNSTRETAVSVSAIVAPKELQQSGVLESNDAENNRLGRYLRTMPMLIRPPLYHRSVEARSAAAAAAVAAENDLKHFGRTSKYHTLPYDGRKFAAAAPSFRQTYGANTRSRYRYVNDDVVYAAASSKGKWGSHLQQLPPSLPSPSSSSSSSSRYASTSSDELLSSYDDGDADADADAEATDDLYYEDGHAIAIAGDESNRNRNRNDNRNRNRDRDQENADSTWPYREIMQKEGDLPVVFEDVEPTLSSKRTALTVGKRAPFTNNRYFELYAPHTKAHAAADVDVMDVTVDEGEGKGTGKGDGRYKKYSYNRGRDKANLDWNGAAAVEWFVDGGGGGGGNSRPTMASASLKRNRLRGGGERSKPAFSPYKMKAASASSSSKQSLFKADGNRHRFKVDSSARYPSRGASSSTATTTGIRGNFLSFYRGRNNKRYRDRDRDRNRYAAAFNDDKELSPPPPPPPPPANDDVVDDNENEIFTVAAAAVRRRPSQQIQDDDVVYSSRYRNKQLSSADGATEHVLDNASRDDVTDADADGDTDADEADSSSSPRFFVGYHRNARPVVARFTKKPKFAATNNKVNRKSNTNRNGNNDDQVGDYDDAAAASSPFISSADMEESGIDGNGHLRKLNYKLLSRPVSSSAFTSTPSSLFLSSSSSLTAGAAAAAAAVAAASDSPSAHGKRTSSPMPTPNNHRTLGSPSVIVFDTSNVTNTAELYNKLEQDHLKTRSSYGTAAAAAAAIDDANVDFNFGSNSNESDADAEADGEADDSKSDSTRISASELIAYMSASPSEPRLINKQDRFSKPKPSSSSSSTALFGLGYPFVRTFSEQHQYGHDQLESNFYQPALALPAPFGDQDFEINLD